MSTVKFWCFNLLTSVKCFLENFVPLSIEYIDTKKETKVHQHLNFFKRYFVPWKYLIPKVPFNIQIHYKVDNKRYTYIHRQGEDFSWPPCPKETPQETQHANVVFAIKVSNNIIIDITAELLSMMGPHLDFHKKTYLTRDLFPDAKFICITTFRDTPTIFMAEEPVVLV